MFGTPMAHIDNYIHLNINKNETASNQEIGQPIGDQRGPTYVTGSLKERKTNVTPIELRTSIFDLAWSEHDKMEHWNAWGEFSRDLKDLINYRNFKAKAEACDLLVEHHSTYGWSITSPSDALLEFCMENDLREIRLCRNDFEIFRVSGTGATAGNATKIVGGNKKSSTRKYICPCCGMSVRATRTVNIACMDCNEQLIVAA